ncbi:hypothetical protein D3C81_2147320 [compost metagenome]
MQGNLGFDLVQAGQAKALVELRRVIGQMFEIVLEPRLANELVDQPQHALRRLGQQVVIDDQQ